MDTMDFYSQSILVSSPWLPATCPGITNLNKHLKMICDCQNK